jgi:type I site-specific restriction endonuclease
MEKTDGDPKILVASFGTFSTGINIKAIMNVVFADSFKSDQIIRQSIGRGLRLHAEKDKLVVFDIVDRFHKSYTNILYNQYISRRDNIYKKQEFPINENIIKV